MVLAIIKSTISGMNLNIKQAAADIADRIKETDNELDSKTFII